MSTRLVLAGCFAFHLVGLGAQLISHDAQSFDDLEVVTIAAEVIALGSFLTQELSNIRNSLGFSLALCSRVIPGELSSMEKGPPYRVTKAWRLGASVGTSWENRWCSALRRAHEQRSKSRPHDCRRAARRGRRDPGGRPHASPGPTVQSFICRLRRKFARLSRPPERSCQRPQDGGLD